jgi:chromosome partitioning protein
MFDSRNTLAEAVVADVRGSWATRSRNGHPAQCRVSEAPSAWQPVLLRPNSGSQAYLKLASEVIQRERLHRGLNGAAAITLYR